MLTQTSAQLSPYYSFHPLYEEGVELFDKGHYGAAEKKLTQFLQAEEDLRAPEGGNDLHVHAEFLQALSAAKLEREDAVSMMQAFIREHAANSRAGLMRYHLGKFYFDRQKFEEAIEPLEEAYQAGGMTQERFEETVFLLGYSHFKAGDLSRAKVYFEQVSRRENPYQEDARYYYAVILYQEQDYLAAYDALSALENSPKYGQEIKVYLANTLLKLKRYDELYVLADELIAGPQVQGQETEIYYIVANASFERNDYPRTTEFFNRYVQARGRMNRHDYFRYGYAEYQQNEFARAVPIFQKALGQSDSLEQVASYYLGFCFLKIQPPNQDAAKLAFQKAVEVGNRGNPEIVKDALFQYAKASFATRQYSEAIKALVELSRDYPQADFMPEVQAMIGEAFLYQRDYPRSIRYFESIPRTTARTRQAYQMVCYYYALEQYEKPSFNRAIAFFQKAVDNDYDRDMAQSAQFWLAEATYRKNDFTAAERAYQQFLRMPGASKNKYYARGFYGLGWTHFKQKQYGRAEQQFEDFLGKTSRQEQKNVIVDAYLRLGDCLFLQRKYSQSARYYQQVLDLRFAHLDYAAYQLAEGYYRQNQYSKSVNTFDQMISRYRDSDLRDNALDRISEIYATWIKDNGQALKYARMLVEEYPRSPLAADALNRMAIAAFNAGNQEGAISYFKKVLTDYAKDEKNAKIALDNLSSLLPEREFDRVLRDYRNQNPQMDTNLASLVFQTGKDRFFAGNYRSAMQQFSDYIKDYRNGPDYYEALMFRARSYRELGQFQEALQDFQRVYGAQVRNDFMQAALLEAAALHYEQANYLSALELYQTLAQDASNLTNRVQALFGVAQSHRALDRHDPAIDALQEIANNAEVAEYSRTKARVAIGHNQYAAGRLPQALQTFRSVESEFKNAFGAESQRMIVQITFDQGMKHYTEAFDLEQAGKIVEADRKFAEAEAGFKATIDANTYMKNNFPAFNYEKALAFLVVAEAYFFSGNTFQAKGTLESLINQDEFPEVKQRAQTRLAEIEAQEVDAPR